MSPSPTTAKPRSPTPYSFELQEHLFGDANAKMRSGIDTGAEFAKTASAFPEKRLLPPAAA